MRKIKEWLELTDITGESILINIAYIVSLRKCIKRDITSSLIDGMSYKKEEVDSVNVKISISNSKFILVRENYDYIVDRIELMKIKN